MQALCFPSRVSFKLFNVGRALRCFNCTGLHELLGTWVLAPTYTYMRIDIDAARPVECPHFWFCDKINRRKHVWLPQFTFWRVSMCILEAETVLGMLYYRKGGTPKKVGTLGFPHRAPASEAAGHLPSIQHQPKGNSYQPEQISSREPIFGKGMRRSTFQ